MANIKITVEGPLMDGHKVTFKAPCNCDVVEKLDVRYIENNTQKSKLFTMKDSHGNDLTGLGNLFFKDAYVDVVLDPNSGSAYLQNAGTNGYLEERLKTAGTPVDNLLSDRADLPLSARQGKILNESLQNENNESFNFGYKDGVRGFYTNPSRADDSFIPFIKLSGTPLYHYGTDFKNITGGWNDDFSTNDQKSFTPHEKTDRYIYLKSNGQGDQSACTTINKIDLTKYNSLHYTVVGVGGNLGIFLTKDKTYESSSKITIGSGMTGTYFDATYNLSNISGEYYLTFNTSNNASRSAKIYDVWLE